MRYVAILPRGMEEEEGGSEEVMEVKGEALIGNSESGNSSNTSRRIASTPPSKVFVIPSQITTGRRLAVSSSTSNG